MTYSAEQLKAMCPAHISECSQKHVQSVIAELIETALAQPASVPALDKQAAFEAWLENYPIQIVGDDYELCSDAFDAGVLAASPQQAHAVPGFVMVPVEPTDDMLANVDEEVGGHCHSCSKWNASWSDCRRVYAAMLAAAPQAPQPAQAVPQLTGCNCRWDGETQVQWCELHAAHKEAIHDWGGRAKAAEAKLAAPQPEAKPQWQPIETAPEETEVLIGCWIDGTFKWGRSELFYEQANEFEGETFSGWVWAVDYCDDSVAEAPTHWMPLPAAPSAQAEQGGK